MQVNTLHPPNLQTLSENVIGSVMQRSRTSIRVTNNVHAARSQFLLQGPQDGLTSRAATGRKSSSPQQPTTGKLSYADRIRENIAAYHRERRRKSQERYRAKQRQLTADLTVTNHELKQEIDQLRQKHETLLFGITTTNNVWSVAAKYFRVFRCGLLATEGACMLELDFLRATMAPDLDAGTVHGLEASARNWEVFTRYFDDVQIRLRQLDQSGENSLVATTTTSITITRSSISNVFPHLMNDKEAESRIVDRLLGQRLVMRGSVHFNWDSSTCRVVSLITRADMVSPLLQLLGNLEDVSLVFSHALVNPECNVVEQFNLCYYI